MPLQKQIVTVSLGNGVDTKTDPYQIQGKVAVLENGIFSSPKELRKRSGFQALARSVFSSTTGITAGAGTTTFKNELLSFDGTSLFSFSPSAQMWSNKGSLVNLEVTSKPIIRNSNLQLVQDSALHSSGLQIFTWEDSSGGIRYSVTDSSTNQQIVANAVLSAGKRAKPVVLGNYFVVFYFNPVNGRIQYKSIALGSPTLLSAAVDFNTTMNTTNYLYDVAVFQNIAYLVFNNSIGSISSRSINSYLQTSNVYSFGSDSASNAINVAADASGNLWVSYCNGTATKVTVVNNALSGVLVAPQVVETVLSRNITTSISGTTATIFYEVAGATEYKNQIRINTCTLLGVVGTASRLVGSVGIVSKAFSYNGSVYVITAYGPSPTSTNTATLQPSYFVLNSLGQVVGKVANQNAGGVTVASILTEVNVVSPGVFQFAFLQKDFISTIAGNVFSNTGVMSGTFDFVDAQFQTLELGSNLHITGGILSCYDGATISEHGFHLFPEGLTAAAGSGGSLSSGSYGYSAVYRWTDAQGQDHNSAPSQLLTISVSGGATVLVTVPTLRLTGKSNVRIMLYRTFVNQTVLYAVTTIATPVLNDPTVDSITITDGLADSVIIGNEQIYTTGGVIENIAAPATQIIGTYKNRLIIVPSENGLTWWFSKQTVPGSPVEVNDTFVKNIDQRGGSITAVAQLDANLVFLKSHNIFYTTGDGPSANGLNDDFAEALLIAADSGCVNTKSLVQVPAGLMYQSSKGIYLLNRSLVDYYIGADVEAYNSSSVTSAQLLATSNQVRFTLNTGVCLTYDTAYNQWSVFTNIAAADSTVFQNVYCYIQSNGTIQQETPGQFNDNGSAIKLRVVLAWMSMAGLQGYQRVYKATILGTYKSPHKLLVKVGYDFIPVFTQSDLIDTTAIINPTAPYASGTGTYASGAGVYGGQNPVYQFRVDLAQQKCDTLQISIEDIQTSNYGEGFSLSAIAFEVGQKGGLNRLPATRIFG
jgi:hypothetical protein